MIRVLTDVGLVLAAAIVFVIMAWLVLPASWPIVYVVAIGVGALALFLGAMLLVIDPLLERRRVSRQVAEEERYWRWRRGGRR